MAFVVENDKHFFLCLSCSVASLQLLKSHWTTTVAHHQNPRLKLILRHSLAQEPKTKSEAQSLLVTISRTLFEAWKLHLALLGGVGDFFIVFKVLHLTQRGKNLVCQKIVELCLEKATCKMKMSLLREHACFDALPNLSLSLSLVLNVK